jgi:translation initiation factor IF-3
LRNTNNFGFRPYTPRPAAGGFRRPGGFNRGRYQQQQTNHKFYFTNQRIEAPQLRVIDFEGKQVGLLSRDEALREAQTRELDLVLIAPNAQPPVAKIIDFKKFLYQEEKKAREAKKGIKKSIVKDVNLSLFIAQADLDRLKDKTKEFLADGNQVRLNLTLKGRELGKKMMAFELMKKFISELEEVNISKEPRIEGRVVRAVISRKK